MESERARVSAKVTQLARKVCSHLLNIMSHIWIWELHVEVSTSKKCDCPDCKSHSILDCINYRCYCCNLEDAFALFTGQEKRDLILGWVYLVAEVRVSHRAPYAIFPCAIGFWIYGSGGSTAFWEMYRRSSVDWPSKSLFKRLSKQCEFITTIAENIHNW